MMNSSDPGSFSNVQIVPKMWIYSITFFSKNHFQCSNFLNVDWKKIITCVQSDEGDRALAYFGKITMSADPKLTYVPHIVFNGIFNATIENEARINFLKTVCQLYIHKPDGCKY